MKLLDRFVTFFAALLIGALSLMTLSNYIGGIIGDAGRWLYENLMYSWVSTFIMQVAIVMAIAYLLEMTIRPSRGAGRLLKRTTESGDIFVTTRTIESFARNMAREIEGVQDVELTARSKPEGLELVMRVVAAKDAVLPELTAKLENRIKEGLPAQSGFPVKSVKTYISSSL